MEGLVTMRKLHIQQFKELVETLQSAGDELKVSKNNAFLDLCSQMQEFVSVMFEYVESTLEEKQKLLELLRELYEKLYFLSQGNILVEEVTENIEEIKIETDRLQPNKFEVAFLCYKASMSDCLESIYFAAKKDPCCDAYFIPIPYFDKNTDGTLGKMHYEGKEYYSQNYEITDWQQYNFEERKPDVIFVMNPYDSHNYVTSVHPVFYSERLKNHTDNLVYVEYGLPFWLYRNPLEPELREEYRKKGMPLPVHLHSHYNIVYSKELAEGYLPIFDTHPEIAERYKMTPERVKEKFVALGSPKFDKIINAVREDYNLPTEWAKQINGKKTILYNTTIGEFLKSSDQQKQVQGEYEARDSWYFGKLRSILEVFQESEDAVLWWRPHPLFEATLRAMQPDLLEEYLNIVQEYKKLQKGIFDDTEDLHRAIVCSDGMISDESSLLLLYAATGKPFYIPAIVKRLPYPVIDNETDYKNPLVIKLNNMRGAKGANIWNFNCCICWDIFLEENYMGNIRYENYTQRFIDFVVNVDKYPEAEEYKKLQLQMIQDFVVNADGTAGQKIYEYVKNKVIK